MANQSEEKKPVYKKWWFWLIIVLVVIIIAGSNGSEDNANISKTTLNSNNEISETNANIESNVTEKKSKYSVGEIYENNNIAIKYVSLDDNFKGYSQYAEVKSGYKIIKAEFEFENVGSTDFLASSYDFNCYADGYDCEAFWSVDDSSFSSTLSSGKKAKGSVYFQVPENATEITLEYEINAWTSEKVEFIVK